MATAAVTKNFTSTFAGVEICGATSSIDISADSIDVTTSCSTNDDAREFIQGRYQWTHAVSGPADMANGGGIETLFDNICNVSAAGGYQTLVYAMDDGGKSVTNPDFGVPTASGQLGVFVTSLSLSADTGGAATFSTTMQGSGVLARDES